MKICSNCGMQLDDRANYCPRCGSETLRQHKPVFAKKKANGLGIAALVLNAVSYIVSWLPIINIVGAVLALVGVGLGIPGIILGAKRRRGLGIAIAGTAVGLFSIATVLLMYMGTDIFTTY